MVSIRFAQMRRAQRQVLALARYRAVHGHQHREPLARLWLLLGWLTLGGTMFAAALRAQIGSQQQTPPDDPG